MCVKILGVIVDVSGVVMRGWLWRLWWSSDLGVWLRSLMLNLSFVFFWVLIEVFMKIDKDDMEKTRSTKICVMIYFWKKKNEFFILFYEDDEGWLYMKMREEEESK